MIIMHKKRIIAITIAVSCFAFIFEIYNLNNFNSNHITITPIMTNRKVFIGEVLSLKSVTLDNKKVVLKEDVKKYITTENLNYFLDNKNFFKNNVENGNDLLLKDIVNINK